MTLGGAPATPAADAGEGVSVPNTSVDGDLRADPEIGREKQIFCAVCYSMRGLFLSWSQLSSQEKACKVKLSLGLEYEPQIEIWTYY